MLLIEDVKCRGMNTVIIERYTFYTKIGLVNIPNYYRLGVVYVALRYIVYFSYSDITIFRCNLEYDSITNV